MAAQTMLLELWLEMMTMTLEGNIYYKVCFFFMIVHVSFYIFLHFCLLTFSLLKIHMIGY